MTLSNTNGMVIIIKSLYKMQLAALNYDHKIEHIPQQHFIG